MGRRRPDICVCICTYDRCDVLAKAVDSAKAQTLAEDRYEILVVDNSRDRARAAALAGKYEALGNLKYVVENTPGLSNARNAAAHICSAPVIAFLDDDAVAAPEWAQELLRAFDRFGAPAAIVGGRVEPMWAAPRPPWLHDELLGNLSVVDWGGEARIAASHEWVAGANIAFRVEDLLAHGGFPLNLGRKGSGSNLLSNEEVELIARMRAAGRQLVYAPRARVGHRIDAKRLEPAWFRKRAAWQAVSDFLMEPDRLAVEAKTHWPNLIKYFNALPPLERTVRGLAYDCDDPELFRWQFSAIYMLSALLLAGFDGVELG